jgi:hypothetical protein
MKIIGFIFTKLHANRKPEFKSRTTREIKVDFIDVKEEKNEELRADIINSVSFSYSVQYNEPEAKKANILAEVLIEGKVIISLDKNEAKEFSKSWKKKDINPVFKAALFNVILRKCTPRALDLEDHLNLPSHLPFPQVKLQQKQ